MVAGLPIGGCEFVVGPLGKGSPISLFRSHLPTEPLFPWFSVQPAVQSPDRADAIAISKGESKREVHCCYLVIR